MIVLRYLTIRRSSNDSVLALKVYVFLLGRVLGGVCVLPCLFDAKNAVAIHVKCKKKSICALSDYCSSHDARLY
jgi:hypothetical protein